MSEEKTSQIDKDVRGQYGAEVTAGVDKVIDPEAREGLTGGMG